MGERKWRVVEKLGFYEVMYVDAVIGESICLYKAFFCCYVLSHQNVSDHQANFNVSPCICKCSEFFTSPWRNFLLCRIKLFRA